MNAGAFEVIRARIGLLIPSVNVVMETDFRRYLPPGLQAHAHRVYRRSLQSTHESENQVLADSLEAAKALAHTRADVIVFGCTAATILEGAGGDRIIGQRLTDATGIPTVTTATAVVEALRHLNARRVAMLTPYRDEINETEREFLQASGFEVTQATGMQILESLRIPQVGPGQIYRFVRDELKEPCDAVFISCTNFRAWEALPYLEADLGVPVVTSNQASCWAALRLLGESCPVRGGGRLFEEPA